MNALTLLSDLQAKGFCLRPEGNNLCIAPSSALTLELRQLIIAHKAALLAILRPPPLPEPPVVSQELERLLALGQRLKRGEITALRCGKTGEFCRHCQGVPCWGSEVWA
ncbi:MAG: hypothetical protein HYU86_07790 [Chloroflexi bacterium]|nr:hypothetical protein [Chloroflexota bacterium]